MLLVSANNTLVRVPSTIPGTDIEYNYVENVTVQIPDTEFTFELQRVAENVGVSYNDGIPTYSFAFYEGGSIKLNKDMEMLWSTRAGNLAHSTLWSWGDGVIKEYHTGDVINIVDYSKSSKTTRDLGEVTRTRNSYSTTLINELGEQIATVEFVYGYGDGVCPYDLISFDGVELIDISNFLPHIVNSSLSLVEPTKTVIRYKDGIVLHVEIEEVAEEITVEWIADNDNFKMEESDDGLSCTIISESKGDTIITATLYNENGNIIGEDSVEMTSKAGFFDKIGGLFRSLFGTTKVYES